MTSFNGKSKNLQKTLIHFFFALAITISDKVTKYNFRNDNIRWQLSKFTIDYASSNCFRDINIFNFLPLKSRSRLRSTIFAMTLFDSKCQNLQMPPRHFRDSFYALRDIIFFNVWPSKIESNSRSKIFAITPFDGKT